MMEGVPAQYMEPGPDQQPQTLGYHLQAALAIISADRQVLPDEQRELAGFIAAVQAVAMQNTAAMPQEQTGPLSEETSDFGSEGGGEDLEEPESGAEFGGVY
jgi:hypothetical protein